MIGYGATATTHDFFAFNSAGDVWNGSAFTAWVDGSYATYRITATEVGTSGRFTGTTPSATVSYQLRLRGASLALSSVVWTGGDDVNMTSTGQAALTSLSYAASWLEGAGIAPGAFTSAKFSSDALQAIADALLDRTAGVETNLTFRQWLRLVAALQLGKTTNGQKTFRDFNDTKDRVTATLEADGDRTVLVRDAT